MGIGHDQCRQRGKGETLVKGAQSEAGAVRLVSLSGGESGTPERQGLGRPHSQKLCEQSYFFGTTHRSSA